GSGLLVRPNGVACAFSASLSHRSPKLRWLAATSGELANLARRAHSAAWARQYITYDDIARTHSHIPRTQRPTLKLRLLYHHSYLCRDATRQEVNEPTAEFCSGLLHCNHRARASNARGTFEVQPSPCSHRPLEPALPP